MLKKITFLILGSAFLISLSGCAGNQEFANADADHNGYISWGEMQGYQQSRFNDMDNDNDGLVDQGEMNAD